MVGHSDAATMARGKPGSVRAAHACCAPARGGRRPWPVAQGPRARTSVHRHGSGDAASVAARTGQANAAVLGRVEAVTAPEGGKRVVHAF